MPVDVSVVVCTRNRASSLGDALSSIIAADPAELIVIDQSTDDASLRVVESMCEPRIAYQHTPTPGLSRAYNLGIAAAKSEVVAFTDDDCAVPADWLESIGAIMAANPDVAMAYGQVRIGRMRMRDGDYIPALTFKEERRYTQGRQFEVFGMGANFAARRSDLLEVGGFDEALGGGGIFRSSQDSDMQLRLWRAGKTVLAHPGFAVDHFGLRTPEEWKGTAKAYGFGDGAFLIKHARLRDTTAIRLLTVRSLKEAAKPMVRALRRQSYSGDYAIGLLQGVRAGLRHPLDRRSRTYVLNG